MSKPSKITLFCNDKYTRVNANNWEENQVGFCSGKILFLKGSRNSLPEPGSTKYKLSKERISNELLKLFCVFASLNANILSDGDVCSIPHLHSQLKFSSTVVSIVMSDY